ncbi:MAG: 4-hydroxy-3-methylbut-2-enyl diphosphate reductase [Lentisphaeria bacterium]|nr:4-hydroxy-3-methylbut-2-enyl diphosphate reductase [Lentisphaeria bacterium]
MKIHLAKVYGFCAGVRRAVEIVEQALNEHEKIYLIHELVHNEQVSAELAARGVCSVAGLDAVPDGATLVLSAHGTVPEVFEMARKKKLNIIDATCPLVRKVQQSAANLTEQGVHVLLFGKKQHREVEGIVGHAVPGMCTVLENRAAVETFVPEAGQKYATLSQTTLNEQEIMEMNEALLKKIPDLQVSGNVCKATGERQEAVRLLAEKCDAVLIIGSENSSNTLRLLEVAKEKCHRTHLVSSPDDLPDLTGVDVLGVSAGASAPESLIRDVLRKISCQDPTTCG